MIQLLLKYKIPVEFSCRYFGVNRSHYYRYIDRKNTIRFQTKAKIVREIKKIFRDSHETYGSPRIFRELKKQGIKVSENTVAKYMNELSLDARLKKKFRVQTTDSNHHSPIADRLFKVEEHQTLPAAPGELLAGDITYLRLGSTFVYLAVVLDVFTREVVGWSMQKTLHTSLVLDAMSIAMKKMGSDSEIIFHSDRGSQYASDAYRKFLKQSNVLPSMSRRGNCYDNSYVESWFSSLKKEWIYRKPYSTESELKSLVFQYIETWYNNRRSHSALGYRSPKDYKKLFSAAR